MISYHLVFYVFVMSLLRFNIESMIHVPGKKIVYFRYFVKVDGQKICVQRCQKFYEKTEAYVCFILDSLPVLDIKLQQIIDAQDNDEVCKTIKQYCFENWPERHLLPSAIRPYWTVVQNVF